MAEAIARSLSDPESDVRFESAGIHALEGAPATELALRAAAEAGADASGIRSRPLTPEIVRAADEVYTMTRAHRAALVRLVPEAAARAQVLDPSGADVEDPYGGSADDYRAACAHIRGAVEARMPGWAR